LAGDDHGDLQEIRMTGRETITPKTQESLKRLAKHISRVCNMPHMAALEFAAKRAGAFNYRVFMAGIENEKLKNISFHDIKDAAEYICYKLLIPARMHALRRLSEAGCRPAITKLYTSDVYNLSWEMVGSVREIGEELLLSFSVKDMFENYGNLLSNLEEHDKRITAFKNEVSWAPFIGDIDLGDGIQAREMVSQNTIRRRGVGGRGRILGYIDKILWSYPERVYVVFSMERGTEFLGTAEIYLKYKGVEGKQGCTDFQWEVDIDIRDCRISAIAENEILRVTKEAAPQRAMSYLDGLMEAADRLNKNRHIPAHIMEAGYDIWEPGRLEIAWEELSVYLPKHVRKNGLEGLIKENMKSIVKYEDAYLIEKNEPSLFTGISDQPFWENDAISMKALEEASMSCR
jgi:hypothetical protein